MLLNAIDAIEIIELKISLDAILIE